MESGDVTSELLPSDHPGGGGDPDLVRQRSHGSERFLLKIFALLVFGGLIAWIVSALFFPNEQSREPQFSNTVNSSDTTTTMHCMHAVLDAVSGAERFIEWRSDLTLTITEETRLVGEMVAEFSDANKRVIEFDCTERVTESGTQTKITRVNVR